MGCIVDDILLLCYSIISFIVSDSISILHLLSLRYKIIGETKMKERHAGYKYNIVSSFLFLLLKFVQVS